MAATSLRRVLFLVAVALPLSEVSALRCLSCIAGGDVDQCDSNDSANYIRCDSECYKAELTDIKTSDKTLVFGCNSIDDRALLALHYRDPTSGEGKMSPTGKLLEDRLIDRPVWARLPSVKLLDGRYKMRVRFCRSRPQLRADKSSLSLSSLKKSFPFGLASVVPDLNAPQCEAVTFCAPPYCSAGQWVEEPEQPLQQEQEHQQQQQQQRTTPRTTTTTERAPMSTTMSDHLFKSWDCRRNEVLGTVRHYESTGDWKFHLEGPDKEYFFIAPQSGMVTSLVGMEPGASFFFEAIATDEVSGDTRRFNVHVRAICARTQFISMYEKLHVITEKKRRKRKPWWKKLKKAVKKAGKKVKKGVRKLLPSWLG